MSTASNKELCIVVVESHQHVLEHIHAILRKEKRILGNSWTMIHFDAHPDMACSPTLCARSCFQPNGETTTTEKSLYEQLDDTSSGIAEWILPLTLSANLGTIKWIKPSFSHQIEEGQHSFRVGVVARDQRHSGQGNVNVTNTKSAQQQSVLALQENNKNNKNGGDEKEGLQATAHHEKEKKRTLVSPSHLPPRQKRKCDSIHSFLDLSDHHVIGVDWLHPYYLDDTDKEQISTDLHLAKTIHLTVEQVQNNGKKITSGTEKQTQQHNNAIKINDNEPWMLDICLDYFCCRNPFVLDLELINQDYASTLVELSRSMHEQMIYKHTNLEIDSYQEARASLLNAFSDLVHENSTQQDAGKKDHTGNDWFAKHCSESQMDQVQTLCHHLQGEPRLKPLTLDALNYLALPHEPRVPDESVLDQRVEDAIQYIKILLEEDRPCPFLITMARSSLDCFTPAHVVENLQVRILRRLHELFCGCPTGTQYDWTTPSSPCSCSVIRLLFDYGKWEGSTF